MSELQIFKNAEFGSVRTVTVEGEPHFVAKDVAEILGYSNPRDAINKHVDEEDKGVAKCDTLGGKQELTVINESGLYSLILSSKMPNAKKFKRWVTAEVLPTIRRHGLYAMDEVLANPDILINALLELKAERERNANLEAMVAIPFAPHLLMPQYMDEGTERELALRMGIIFLSKCEQLWMFGERISNGMAYEIKKAVSMGKKVCYFTADCREVES